MYPEFQSSDVRTVYYYCTIVIDSSHQIIRVLNNQFSYGLTHDTVSKLPITLFSATFRSNL